MSKKTIILGASPNRERYSNRATIQLNNHGHEAVPVGIRKGEIGGIEIKMDLTIEDQVDTITLYLNPTRQPQYYDYILNTNPKRIIFNPGTENSELVKLAEAKGIKTIYACTLVMLSIGDY